MTFLWPAGLWLLLALPPLVALYFFLLERRKKRAVRFPNTRLIRAALGTRASYRRHVPPLLFALGLITAIIAIARPAGNVALLGAQRTIIMAIDVSLSMRATDIEPTRIDAAKSAAKAFVKQQPEDVRIGIVSFGGSAALVQPPTRNKDDLVAAIDRLQVQRATAIGSGLALSLAALFPDDDDVESSLLGQTHAPRHSPPLSYDAKKGQSQRTVPAGSDRSVAIILLTDGRRTVGPDPMEIARLAAEHGVRIFTVGFGKANGGTVDVGSYSIYMEFDELTLKSIADITKADYFHAPTADQLDKVYHTLNARFVLEQTNNEVSALLEGVAALLFLAADTTSLRWFGGIA